MPKSYYYYKLKIFNFSKIILGIQLCTEGRRSFSIEGMFL